MTESFKVADGDLWSNAAAYKGGFAVRVAGVIYFYDNAGTLKGQVDQATSGESFDRGRGDGTRLAGHINSPYVFLAGAVTGHIVRVTAWDAQTQSFVAVADVSEPGFTGTADRVNLAVDALNRITVGWVVQPAGYEQVQVAARVLVFDDAKKSITPLTSSFFPFINVAQTGLIRTLQMSVAMTTKQICIAAKGEINLENKPELGANSPSEINFYTVFTHPDPKDDPTTPVGGPPPAIAIGGKPTFGAGKINLAWAGGQGPFTVQKKGKLNDANWVDVLTTADRVASVDMIGGEGYLRVVGK